jgi:hypothetical protein
MLQRTIESFANQFGFSHRQVSDALKRLRDKNLIRTELRSIKTSMGRIPNVLFLAPITDTLHVIQASIPLVEEEVDEASQEYGFFPTDASERSLLCNSTWDRGHLNVRPHVNKRMTNTENTTQITTKNTPPPERCAILKQETVSTAAVGGGDIFKNCEPVIGETITPLQQQTIAQFVAQGNACHLGKSESKLSEEIIFCLLDANRFTHAGNDFYRKFNTIKKIIREGRWHTPAGLVQSREEQAKSEKDTIDKAFETAVRELQDLERQF